MHTDTNFNSKLPMAETGVFRRLLDRVKGDKVIWFVVIMLSIISVLAVYSATRSIAYKNDKNSADYLVKQLLVLGFGFIIIYLVHRLNYTKFMKLSVLFYVISIPLLIYTLAFGTRINGASRWIELPVIKLTFQSSDFAKLALFMFLARMMSIKQNSIKNLRTGFVPVLMPVLIICALIAFANLSTALMLGATCCILFFIGRVQVKHIALLAAVGLGGVIAIYTISKVANIGRAATWEKRIANFAGGGADIDGDRESMRTDNYQAMQGKIAVANGGFFGLGPGHSMQRDYLPEAFSDFIFATILEEYGLFGGGVLIFLYLTFLWRSILIFRRCPYAFGAFLAVGLSITLVFQAMLNMGVAVHLLPVTGLTLPLVSMGGSSIWFTSIAVGIVLSVSRYVDEMEGAGKDAGNSPIEVGEEEEEEEPEVAVTESTIIIQKPIRKTKNSQPEPSLT